MELSLFGLALMIEFNAFDFEEIDDLFPFTYLILHFFPLMGLGVKSQLDFLQQGLPGMCFY